MRIGIFGDQRGALRAAADHHLGTRQIEIEESLEILVDGDAADIEEDRARQSFEGGLGARFEHRLIDAVRPEFQALEVPVLQFGEDIGAGHQHPGRRGVEMTHAGIGDEQRHARALLQIFGKFRMVGGREGKLVPKAPAARRPAERALGGQMDGVGGDALQLVRENFARQERQRNLRIGGAGKSSELFG